MEARALSESWVTVTRQCREEESGHWTFFSPEERTSWVWALMSDSLAVPNMADFCPWPRLCFGHSWTEPSRNDATSRSCALPSPSVLVSALTVSLTPWKAELLCSLSFQLVTAKCPWGRLTHTAVWLTDRLKGLPFSNDTLKDYNPKPRGGPVVLAAWKGEVWGFLELSDVKLVRCLHQ